MLIAARVVDRTDGLPSRLRNSRIWLLVVTCMCVLLVISAMIALNTALGDIARDTLATQAQLTWIVDAYTLSLACLLLLGGTLGDRYGRRGALIAGLVIFGAASFVPIYFDSPVGIIAGRAATGIGAAFVLPATLSLLTRPSATSTSQCSTFSSSWDTARSRQRSQPDPWRSAC